jgi:AcrR family transcriptional regulator
MIETRDKILDAAERLFADGGYAATSLRSIMALAEVNVAAVHYHFRSKEALLEAVLLRRVGPANEERLRLLEEYERECGGEPTVEGVLEAFLLPTFEMAADAEQGGYTFVRLLGRLQAESEVLPKIVVQRFGPVLLRFADALTRALPELPSDELFWRARLALGATAQILRDAPRIKATLAGDTPDWQAMLHRLIPFLSAGFRAPLETMRYQAAGCLQEER